MNGELQDALEALRWHQKRLAQAQQEIDAWQHAAYCKLRTWETLQGMMRAGDTPEAVAADYGLPVAFVRFLAFPENDVDARYGRPSDRTATAKARAEAAERALREAQQVIVGLREDVVEEHEIASASEFIRVEALKLAEQQAEKLEEDEALAATLARALCAAQTFVSAGDWSPATRARIAVLIQDVMLEAGVQALLKEKGDG